MNDFNDNELTDGPVYRPNLSFAEGYAKPTKNAPDAFDFDIYLAEVAEAATD